MFGGFSTSVSVVTVAPSKDAAISFVFKVPATLYAPPCVVMVVESMAFVERKILDKNAKIYEFFDFQAVKRQVDLHLSGAENKRLFIWSLLNFEEYLANFN